MAKLVYPGDPARAFIEKGSLDNWPPKNAGPSYSLGIATGPSGIEVLPGYQEKTLKMRLWKNPNGNIWDEPGRYGTIKEWRSKWADNPIQQFLNDVYAIRTPLLIPWGKGWTGATGTTDNGAMVNMDPDGLTSYELQGLAPLSALDVIQINVRGFGGDERRARLGDYRCDGVNYRMPGMISHGSQGPFTKVDGLIFPEDLTKMWTGAKRLVGFNVNAGFGALAVDGCWVEHPKNEQPYRETLPNLILPLGAHPDMLPCGVGFYIESTDAQIEQLVTDLKLTGEFANSVRWYMRNLRGYATDKDRPQGTGPREARIQLRESGTGSAVLEGLGRLFQPNADRWIARGVKTVDDGYRLGQNVLHPKYSKLVAVL